MPELPEVEITARRIEEATRGATVESVLAPGMNVMKTFDPPLEALVGREQAQPACQQQQLPIEQADEGLQALDGRARLEEMGRHRSDRFDRRLSGWSDAELSGFATQLAAYNAALSDD